MKEKDRVDPETLESGRVLQMLVEQLENFPCEKHYVAVLRCLRDSFVWIPGEIQISPADVESLSRKKAGDSFSPQHDMKFVPGLLKKDGEFFLPVFSNMEVAEKYGSSLSKIQRHFFDAMRLALGQEDVSGIVLDPFTSPCVIWKGDFIGDLPSLLKLD